MSAQKSLKVRQLFDSESSTYSYVVYDKNSRLGCIIDPVKSQFDRDINLIKEWDIELLYVLETHVHADHITAAGNFRNALACKTAYSAQAGVDCADLALANGEALSLGPFRIIALSTPGHTPGCMCYYIEPYVFTGDTLLIRGTGRSDFQGGDPGLLYDSITQKLYCLEDETIVYPGHDYKGLGSSTIGEEKLYNQRIPMGQNKAKFIQIMEELDLPQPKHIKESVPANMHCGEE